VVIGIAAKEEGLKLKGTGYGDSCNALRNRGKQGVIDHWNFVADK
jgi:hypothetical protein